MVIRDDAGSLMVGRTLHFPGFWRSDEAEIIGLHAALSWLKNLDFHVIEMEMDAKVVVDAINARHFDSTPFGKDVRACVDMMSQFSSISL
ncbi:hypothetical protein ACS0TY_009404 [Phlomoides rotata]